jgi:hypothetical protein
MSARDGAGSGTLTMFVARSVSPVERLSRRPRFARTNVPRPVVDSTNPLLIASAYARVTVTGVTRRLRASSRCVGRRLLGTSTPPRMSRSSAAAMRL